LPSRFDTRDGATLSCNGAIPLYSQTQRNGDVLMNELDLNAVRIFVAVAQAGTLTAAAMELRVPASTVSRALTRLEQHLGVLLVQRSPRGLALTDFGKEYLPSCRRALQTLKQGGELLLERRSSPRGLLKIACPVTVARDVLAPLLKEFLERYPDLRIEIEPYAASWDQEPREGIDIFFKLLAPKDSLRHVRTYPGTVRGLFASPGYIRTAGSPTTPDDLIAHKCIGSGPWKLSRGKKTVTPGIQFGVVTSDPAVAVKLALDGFGIAILPLWMAKSPDVRDALTSILPHWIPEPITLCALFSGPSRQSPKVQVLLDFLDEYLGTDRDPRLKQGLARGYFTDRKLVPTSGP
jgi:LysR family transcriptional regulator, transcriptional activator for dmlA